MTGLRRLPAATSLATSGLLLAPLSMLLVVRLLLALLSVTRLLHLLAALGTALVSGRLASRLAPLALLLVAHPA